MSDSLIFDERPDDLLTLLIKKEGMSESLFFIKKKLLKNIAKNTILVKFFRANRLFFVS